LEAPAKRVKNVETPGGRAGGEKLREQVLELLHRWFIHGLPQELALPGKYTVAASEM
jgi:hypothetical protein